MSSTKKGALQPNQQVDPYFKKVISFKQSGYQLDFRVSQDLFSSFDVDVGTKFLLRTLANNDLGRLRSILDLGCGYGPLGLTLKKLAVHATVHMVDRDALAVDYSRQNAALNGLLGLEIYGSLGYDALRKHDFDLIVSNIPAKVGEAVISYFLRDARHHLAPEGSVAVVVVTPLEALVERILASTPNVAVLLRQARPGHTIFHYHFTDQVPEQRIVGQQAFERGMYHRRMVRLPYGPTTFSLETGYGLPEFDTPSYDTELLLQGIAESAHTNAHHAIIFNPRQGYVALAVWTTFHPRMIALVDRDLLSLMYSRNNLIHNGYASEYIEIAHQVGLTPILFPKADMIAGILRDDEGPEAIAWTINQVPEILDPGGLVVVAGTSTAISRLARSLQITKQLKIEDRKRHMGNSLLVLRANS